MTTPNLTPTTSTTYIPKNVEVYDEVYNYFYGEFGEALKLLQSDFVAEVSLRPNGDKYLRDNESDIKDAAYTAAWDAILTMSDDDGLEIDFADIVEVVDSDLLPVP